MVDMAVGPEPVFSRAGERVLFIASTGGHLTQLVKMSQSWNVSEKSHWITFSSPQSTSMLEGKTVTYVPYVEPRDVRGMVTAARLTRHLLRRGSFDHVVSTGAGVASLVLPMAAMRGIRTTYIESVSRTDGPSMTGRIMRRSPRVRTFTQHSAWSSSQWRLAPSVLSAYHRQPVGHPQGAPKVFVTLGTIRGYEFSRLVSAVDRCHLIDDSALVQLGHTSQVPQRAAHTSMMTAAEFTAAATAADVVITHAGVGTVLALLDLGKFPIVVPRLAVHNEHVDDHQRQICELVRQREVGLVIDADELSDDAIREAARWRISPS